MDCVLHEVKLVFMRSRSEVGFFNDLNGLNDWIEQKRLNYHPSR